MVATSTAHGHELEFLCDEVIETVGQIDIGFDLNGDLILEDSYS